MYDTQRDENMRLKKKRICSFVAEEDNLNHEGKQNKIENKMGPVKVLVLKICFRRGLK